MYGLKPRRDGSLEQIEPVDANSVDLPVTANNAWPANYTQIVASLSYPFLLCGIIRIMGAVVNSNTASTRTTLTYEIATGAAASEATILQKSHGLFGQNVNTVSAVFLFSSGTDFFEPIYIPASTRIAGRATESAAAGIAAMSVYLYGYNANNYSPVVMPMYNENQYLQGVGLNNPVLLTPQAFIAVQQSTVSAWTFGVWKQIPNATVLTRDTLITGVSYRHGASGRRIQGEIGLGAAGSEVSLAAFGGPAYAGASIDANGICELPRPLLAYKGEQVSLRTKSSNISNTTQMQLMGFQL